jgi:hypothetical protein
MRKNGERKIVVWEGGGVSTLGNTRLIVDHRIARTPTCGVQAPDRLTCLTGTTTAGSFNTSTTRLDAIRIHSWDDTATALQFKLVCPFH